MNNDNSRRERVASRIEAAVIASELAWQVGIAIPPPSQFSGARVESSNQELLQQLKQSELPSMEDLVEQAADWEDMRRNTAHQRVRELGYYLKEPERREERSR